MQHGNTNKQGGLTLRQRMVWLLFAVAITAERAADMSWLSRRLVLFFLRRAEKIAYSHVYWAARDCGAPLKWYLPAGACDTDHPDAARLLAWWFRVMAASLRDLGRRAMIVGKARAYWCIKRKSFQPLAGVVRIADLWPDTS